MDRAVLTVSYGVRRVDEIRKSVAPVEKAIAKAVPGCALFRSFACKEGVDALRQAGEEAHLFGESLVALKNSGYKDIGVVPLFIAPGEVYKRIQETATGLPVSGPLLNTEDDLERIADIYGEIARDSGRKVLLMGHGSPGCGDENYMRLAQVLPSHVHLACRRGVLSLDSVLPRLDARRDNILLMPLMLSAGRHAGEEMAGEGPDSWKSILEKRGFDVRVRLDGMGSLPCIQRMFADKALAAME